ncbi:MAG: SDR family oxidoreductase [Candidatus Binatia bacterium]|nr:SDR family oxidoreductase [Candidatus Binatia bacterium]
MRNVLITGASSGIGRETALLLAEHGQRVFAGVRSDAAAKALRSATTGDLCPVHLDVTDAASISAASVQIREALGEGRLQGLVNNAGMTITAPLEFVDLDALRRQFEVNVFGVAAVTKAFLPLLERPDGRVVNVSSGAGKIVSPLIGPYCASKYALEAMSDALRIEIRGQGLFVSVVEPGAIDTPIHEKNDAQLQGMLEALPAQGRARYEPALARLRRMNESMAKQGVPAARVARTIAKALSARRPKTRYPVSAEAHLLAWIGPFLGDRARDAIFGRMVGL